ncbi:hypothetical protein Hdeb2414_s0082g00780491 [Helianthus debilis subsp. tardiflorus]
MEEGSSSKFKTICVFCGSHSGHREVFSVAATQLGDELVNWFPFILLFWLIFYWIYVLFCCTPYV